MTAVDIGLPRLQTEEGFRALPYKDTNGFETIGYGFNVQGGISRIAAAALLAAQAQEAHADLLKLPWYVALDPARQSVSGIPVRRRGLAKYGVLIKPRAGVRETPAELITSQHMSLDKFRPRRIPHRSRRHLHNAPYERLADAVRGIGK